jgi:hypothetical protein
MQPERGDTSASLFFSKDPARLTAAPEPNHSYEHGANEEEEKPRSFESDRHAICSAVDEADAAASTFPTATVSSTASCIGLIIIPIHAISVTASVNRPRGHGIDGKGGDSRRRPWAGASPLIHSGGGPLSVVEVTNGATGNGEGARRTVRGPRGEACQRFAQGPRKRNDRTDPAKQDDRTFFRYP